MSEPKMRALAASLIAVSALFFLARVLPDAGAAPLHPASHKMKAQLGSSAAFDASGVLWAVQRDNEAGTGHLLLQKSTDQGRHWGASVRITTDLVVASGDERPRINFGPRGEIYITYSRPLAKPYTSEVRFVRSDDGGRSFSLPLTVHRDSNIITHGFASTLVDSDGLIYISWIDKRDQQSAKDGAQAYAGAAQYYAVSSDGGRSFTGDYKIADHSCECCRSAMALNRAGRPTLMWRHVFAPNIRDHAIVELTPDGKLAAIERASADNWAIDACPHQGPALAFGADGRRHQTWFTGGSEGGALYYAAQQKDGSLGQPLRLGNEQAAYADVAVSGEQVEVVWKEFDGALTRIRAMHSHDGGATWEYELLASTAGASDQPRLIKLGTAIFLVWRTEQQALLTIPLRSAA